MALSVAFHPVSAMHADPLLNNLADISGSFNALSCGFEPQQLSCIKTEPLSIEESMEEAPYLNTTYTELSSANLAHIKQNHTDLYPDTADPRAFQSWTFRHPEHWQGREVLDWLFSVADAENFDGVIFRGEAYNTLTGKQLCDMSLADFVAIDQNYGSRVHEILQWMLEDANFKKPSPPESFKHEVELLGNVPHFASLECTTDVIHTPAAPGTPSSPASDDSKLTVFMNNNSDEMRVSLFGLGLYDIDLTNNIDITNSKNSFDNIKDGGYMSDNEDVERSNSDVFDTTLSDDEDTSSLIVSSGLGLSRKSHTSSSSSSSSASDSGYEGEERKPHTRKRQTSTTKGNHLWEFIRDLLKDPRFNPNLLKWEDKDMGVFKFMQSEAVAQMWGRKKNNPGMTYEKLSRAMRFCRSAGYFDSVPKTGRFPKKLCFRFGQKAHGWKD